MDKMTNPAAADLLAKKIESLIEESRRRVVTQVNRIAFAAIGQHVFSHDFNPFLGLLGPNIEKERKRHPFRAVCALMYCWGLSQCTK